MRRRRLRRLRRRLRGVLEGGFFQKYGRVCAHVHMWRGDEHDIVYMNDLAFLVDCPASDISRPGRMLPANASSVITGTMRLVSVLRA